MGFHKQTQNNLTFLDNCPRPPCVYTDMYPKSKKRFTLNIIISYVILGGLAILAAFFIYGEFKNYTAVKDQEGERIKLLKTNRLLTLLYEGENLSKLALQTKKSEDLRAYSQSVDSINILIDSLKPLTEVDNGTRAALDSVQELLQQKVYNNAELRLLRVKVDNSGSFDSVLEAIHRMEVDMGRITPKALYSNYDRLSPAVQKTVRDLVAVYNKNIPEGEVGSANIDSILEVSKSILNRAKSETAAIERSMIRKELQIYRTDLELSQKMRNVITGFEREMIQNAYLDNYRQEQILKRSSRLAGGAILLGILIVVVFTLLISKDYWNAQKYREQLEKEKKYSEFLLKSREQLISTVSHDLRTPLTTIGGYSELMEHSGLNSKQVNYLQNIKSASNYVEKLVSELLDYSRLEAGKIKLEKVPFVLSDLIRETSLYFDEVNPKEEVAFILEIDPALEHPISSDPFRIRQILTNLVGNAFKFTQKGHVGVSAHLEEKGEGPWIKIKVQDTGRGIKPEKRELIFQEFAQGEESTQKEFGGYGLGLTISKKLTELLGGHIFLESEEGRGSSFTFRLPVEFAEIPKEGPPGQALSEPPLGSMSLYVVDDDGTLLELLEEIYHINNIQIKTFNGFEALEKEGSIHADLILTDMQMPGIDGFGVLRNLRKMGYERPVIAMTGQKIDDSSLYIGEGFAAVLQKPFSSTEFLLALALPQSLPEPRPAPRNGLPYTHSPYFNIGNIASFLDSPQALQEILEVFLGNTEKNMVQLLKMYGRENVQGIRDLAHKMLPMFRQLEVTGSIPILEELELLSTDHPKKKLSKKLVELKMDIEGLKGAIAEYLVTLQVDID